MVECIATSLCPSPFCTDWICAPWHPEASSSFDIAESAESMVSGKRGWVENPSKRTFLMRKSRENHWKIWKHPL